IIKTADSMAKPAVVISRSEIPTNSYFGGQPPAIEGFEWPRKSGSPLAFLACLDLAEIPDVLPWLPRSGTLLFFYDIENQPWGFDPKDRGSWQVLFSVSPAIGCSRATPP